ncbi:MAG: hypothetical protein J6Z43_08285 [Clostridiales bacterium]|nr:hypothetical protein [Clostridiales bacterium]
MDKRIYFDEETDRRLLEAKSKEEVMAIIATTPAAEKLADKADLIIAEISRLKNSVDEEIGIDDLDEVAGGATISAEWPVNLSITTPSIRIAARAANTSG